ncbi:hypothetical protein D0Z08_25705 [Nocardioides immobilis]|uniref:Uncharacterized protein n=1 Tax=Nocardioides immobilis TaxID=2049295 RepID=A0A417XUK1_9ACTN|nr:hypothetical protein D0Z08_25705 [Nocardioides immobilis]
MADERPTQHCSVHGTHWSRHRGLGFDGGRSARSSSRGHGRSHWHGHAHRALPLSPRPGPRGSWNGGGTSDFRSGWLGAGGGRCRLRWLSRNSD